MKRFRFFALLAFVLSLFLTIPSVSAQANVSCNDSYYKKQSYVDVKVPATGPAGTKPVINFWVYSKGFGLRVRILKNGAVIKSVTTNPFDTAKKWDSLEVNYGETLRYEIKPSANTSLDTQWMPPNVGTYSGKCGTGCPLGGQPGYYAVVTVTPLFTEAVKDGSTPYDLSTKYSLFLDSQRVSGTIDKSVACWNDSPAGDGGKDADYNDWSTMWTISSTTIAVAPEVTTDAPSGILENSAILNGTIGSNGGSTIIERGFVLSKSSTTPTIQTGDKLVISTVTTDLTKNVASLDSGATYYYQAYATNSVGTTYGGVKSFTTSQVTDSLVVNTDSATSINKTSATLNGTLVSQKTGSTITERGFVYSSSNEAPDLNNGVQVIASGTDIGTFSSSLSGLSVYTRYYYVAYAKDSDDNLVYGDVKTFRTLNEDVDHTPEETGFAEDMMIIAGAVLYVVGIMSFMGSKAVAAKQKQQTNPLAEN